VTLTVPGVATQAAYDKACGELSKTIEIPGFRKGARIPPQVLESTMAAKGGRTALRQEAIKSLLAELIEPALKDEHSLEPIGQPTLTVSAEELAESFKPGEELELGVKCDVWPDIEWKSTDDGSKPYIGLSAKYKRRPFNQEKMDQALNDLRDRYAVLEPIDDPSKTLDWGDACVVNMEGFMANADGSKGEPLPNAASGDNVEVVLGQGRYMEGLVEGLIGAKVGDTTTVTVSFPVVRPCYTCFLYFHILD
jgi:trigger factor